LGPEEKENRQNPEASLKRSRRPYLAPVASLFKKKKKEFKTWNQLKAMDSEKQREYIESNF